MLGILLMAAAATAQSTQELTRAVERFDAAQIAGDGMTLGELLAEDYELVNSSGSIEDKTAFLRDLTEPGYKLDPYVVQQSLRRTWEGGAVMGGIVHFTGRSGDKRFDACLRFADVWQLRGVGWKVIYTQVAKLEPSACAEGASQNARADEKK